jgi:hypothetical protein
MEIFYVVALVLSLACACQCTTVPTSNTNGLTNGLTNISVDVAWEVWVNQNTYLAYMVDGNTAYVPEQDGVVAVNLDNGTIRWRTNGVFIPGSNIEKIGNYLYLFENYNNPAASAISNGVTNARIAKIATDGTSIEMLSVGQDINWSTRMYYLSSDITNLYWGAYGNMFVSLNPANMQESVIYNSTDEFIGKILISNNIAYVGHVPQAGISALGYPGTLTAINLQNNQIMWEITPSNQKLFSGYSLELYGNSVYVFDNMSTGCYNINNGAIVFDTTNNCGGSYGGGVFDSNNYCYFTSFGTIGNGVYCINRNNGYTIWYDNIGYTLGTTPQLNNGVLYVDAITHLRLYNAATGVLIGVDTNIKGMQVQYCPTQSYGNLMLISGGSDGMVAVRMDYKM